MYTRAFMVSVASGVALLGVAALARPATVSPSEGASALTLDGAGRLPDADGRMLYLKNCRTCHGATGQPSGETKEKYPKIKALNDAAFLATISDDSMLTILKKGKGKDMKSWKDELTLPEMTAVVAYVRTLPTKKP